MMRVKKALEGYLESPRLLATLIHNIITDLSFKSCTHEPCLYVNKDYSVNLVYFMRQVDDFVVSASSTDIEKSVIDSTNDKMTIKVRSLGIINRFNGVDITQHQYFIKVFNKTYTEQILNDKL